MNDQILCKKCFVLEEHPSQEEKSLRDSENMEASDLLVLWGTVGSHTNTHKHSIDKNGMGWSTQKAEMCGFGLVFKIKKTNCGGGFL